MTEKLCAAEPYCPVVNGFRILAALEFIKILLLSP